MTSALRGASADCAGSASLLAASCSGVGFQSASGFCLMTPCSKNPCNKVFCLPSSFIPIDILLGLIWRGRGGFLAKNQPIGAEVDHDVIPIVGGPGCGLGAKIGCCAQLSRSFDP